MGRRVLDNQEDSILATVEVETGPNLNQEGKGREGRRKKSPGDVCTAAKEGRGGGRGGPDTGEEQRRTAGME